MKLGAHVSISGGIDKAPLYGEEATCDVIQIFSKNQMQWVIPPISEFVAEKFIKNSKSKKIEAISIHASYLLNLASPDNNIRKKSIKDLAHELERADLLHIKYVVFHPGAHLGSGEEKGLKTIAESIKEVFETSNSKESTLLIETTAGEGTHLCYRFEHIRDIFDVTQNFIDRLGVCFDTCHVFQAGYDIRTEESFRKVLHTFDEVIGLKYLKLFHLNDSKKDLGARVDRHEEIGLGKIGLEAFRFLVNNPLFKDLGGILEIPGNIEGYKRNLITLRRLISGHNLHER
ncbi:deoxyribonuclease IV [Caldisericum exile]|uniref:Probable endonuclease 4 n=1 Tax=Caldisericum exile (strain DSM 21853 / NBRC 104410 / AZM16c01) TaxID=511051 RepID=A0A7U6GEC3_CALEA|nr:deoxyribonuclease IV [Caldisericum exile]BAL80836.1 endonuclease IV [Caldisericum exile AZM16c01]